MEIVNENSSLVTLHRRILQDLNGTLEEMYEYESKPKKVFTNLFHNRFFKVIDFLSLSLSF